MTSVVAVAAIGSIILVCGLICAATGFERNPVPERWYWCFAAAAVFALVAVGFAFLDMFAALA